MRFNVRLTQKDGQKLEELANKRGMNASDLIRDMIRSGHERQTVTDALQEIRAAITKIPTASGNGNNQDVAEIKRIVSMIAMAMPSVARHL